MQWYAHTYFNLSGQSVLSALNLIEKILHVSLHYTLSRAGCFPRGNTTFAIIPSHHRDINGFDALGNARARQSISAVA